VAYIFCRRTNRDECSLVERKNAILTSELQDLRTQVEVLEKTRKIVEEELHQASARVTELSAINNSLTVNKKKLETDLHNLSVYVFSYFLRSFVHKIDLIGHYII
jgi:chromosome segregation ATPase